MPHKFEKEFILIHIGKCGGSTVVEELDIYGIKYINKHVCKIEYEPEKRYIIIIRNPIQRFISAFNWRYHLLKNKIQDNPDELDGLEKYKSVNFLAEQLYDENDNLNNEINIFINKIYSYGHPSHVGMGIYFYIGSFLKLCKKEDVIGVILTETLKEDMKIIFNIDVSIHEKKNKNCYDRTLSDLGYRNLKKYLKNDYECIEKLFSLDYILKKQYDILMK